MGRVTCSESHSCPNWKSGLLRREPMMGRQPRSVLCGLPKHNQFSLAIYSSLLCPLSCFSCLPYSHSFITLIYTWQYDLLSAYPYFLLSYYDFSISVSIVLKIYFLSFLIHISKLRFWLAQLVFLIQATGVGRLADWLSWIRHTSLVQWSVNERWSLGSPVTWFKTWQPE